MVVCCWRQVGFLFIWLLSSIIRRLASGHLREISRPPTPARQGLYCRMAKSCSRVDWTLTAHLPRQRKSGRTDCHCYPPPTQWLEWITVTDELQTERTSNFREAPFSVFATTPCRGLSLS